MTQSAADRQADIRRSRSLPWRKWYGLKAWRVKRAQHIKREPLCRYCLGEGRHRAGTEADHVRPHRGDFDLFWKGELQTLCRPHHASVKQREESLGYGLAMGADGWPLDPEHPVNRIGGPKARPAGSIQAEKPRNSFKSSRSAPKRDS